LEYPLWLQIKQMALSLAAGGAIGLLYDMTRAGRQRMKGLFLRELADALFALAAAFLLFWLGMGPGQGALMWFMTAFAALGFAAYMTVFSRIMLPVFHKMAEAAAEFFGIVSFPVHWIRKKANKSKKICRSIFTNANKWFTIIKTKRSVMSSSRSGNRTGGKAGEVQKDQRHNEASYRSPDYLRHSEHSVGEEQDFRRFEGNGHAAKAGYTAGGGQRRASVRHRPQRRRQDHRGHSP
jgi:hypothetical protein